MKILFDFLIDSFTGQQNFFFKNFILVDQLYPGQLASKINQVNADAQTKSTQQENNPRREYTPNEYERSMHHLMH